MIKSVNPATGEVIQTYTPHTPQEIAHQIRLASLCYDQWKTTDFSQRASYVRRIAAILHQRQKALASLMADEMGKVLKDGQAEIAKCIWACEYYADHAAAFLDDIPVITDGSSSYVTYDPLGVILGIMPWNFPFWQALRCAIPALMAGNVVLMKHASNVTGCSLALNEIFQEAGFPPGAFSSLLVSGEGILDIIDHPAIRGVSFTGSASVGKLVAARAGACLKKVVLELGGSDPYILLEDAPVESVAKLCAQSRLVNAGQSCISAKRFIVPAKIKQEFENHLIDQFKNVTWGNPHDPTTHIGPLARADLRETLNHQVNLSVALGASIRLGGFIPENTRAFYPPTILSDVRPGMPAFDEEIFGPVAAIIEAKSEEEAFELANQSPYGLGAALFTANPIKGEQLATRFIEASQIFINTFVRSDPRLPFGGIKESGYGRELGMWGIREFTNIKTVFVA